MAPCAYVISDGCFPAGIEVVRAVVRCWRRVGWSPVRHCASALETKIIANKHNVSSYLVRVIVRMKSKAR